MEHLVTIHENDLRADKIIKNICKDGSYAFIQRLFRTNKIKSNGKKISASDRLHTNDLLEIFADLSESRTDNPEFSKKLLNRLRSMIIFENEDFFAINKPTKLAVQSGTKVSLCVDTFIKSYPNSRCHLVHRLDKDTSGVLLIAKNQETARELTLLFRESNIRKTYLAVVDGEITTPGVIENLLEKSFRGNEEKMRVSESGQKAITSYNPIKSIDYHTLLELKPFTGRKHQLRVHCASVLNAPILGDKKYNPCYQHKELFLHAHKIFIEEWGIEITAEPPPHFQEFL